MQALPSIDVLGFLNWMNIEGYPNLQTHVLFDELFLNTDGNQETAYTLANDYLSNRRFYDFHSHDSIATEFLDWFISIFRAGAIDLMKQHHARHTDLSEINYLIREAFYSASDSLEKVVNHPNYRQCDLPQLLSRYRTRQQEHQNISAWELVESVRFYLIHYTDPMIASLIANTPSIPYFLHSSRWLPLWAR